MHSTMMRTPLSLNHLLERAGTLFGETEIVSRLPDKSLRRHTYAEYYRRTRRLAAALLAAGLQPGDRVATLCWNHHAHLECYFGIPAAGGVMHTLNLRLSPEEIGWIAGHAEDRFLVIDDVLLPLYRQFARHHAFERVFVFPFSGAPVPADAGSEAGGPPLEDYEQPACPRRRSSASSTCVTTRMRRPRCATPRAPQAGPRASSTRTARRCCTRWPRPSPTCGACRRATSCCR
jgi:acyl-CoA synthetase (AMP-forming)/AMP-acid ligase II